MSTSISSSSEIFHCFPKLPMEMQLQIWEYAAVPEPQDVVVTIIKRADDEEAYFKAVTPVPATLQACRNSRAEALKHYTKAFQFTNQKNEVEELIYTNRDLDTLILHLPQDYDFGKFFEKRWSGNGGRRQEHRDHEILCMGYSRRLYEQQDYAYITGKCLVLKKNPKRYHEDMKKSFRKGLDLMGLPYNCISCCGHKLAIKDNFLKDILALVKKESQRRRRHRRN